MDIISLGYYFMFSVPIVLNVNVMSGQTTIYILVSIAAILILAGFIYICRTVNIREKSCQCCVATEERERNLDYGESYEADVMEVDFEIIFSINNR